MFNWLNKNIKWIILSFCAIIFLMITEDLIEKTLYIIDDYVYSHVSLFISPLFTFIFKNITYLASIGSVLIISILFILIVRNKKYSFFILLNLINTTVLNQGLKLLFSRPRPDIISIIKVSGYSYPSGHAMIAVSFYGLFIYLLLKSDIKKSTKRILISILVLLILFIGLSRVYLGVHYASDIIAGYSLSIVYLIIFTSIISKHIMKEVMEVKKERKTIITSIKHASEGIISSFNSEKNMGVHIFIMSVVITIGIICRIDAYEWLICIILFGLVISAELINTSIETTINLYTEEIHPKAKIAKDTAAGAVLVLAIISVIVGLIIFLPKIYILF